MSASKHTVSIFLLIAWLCVAGSVSAQQAAISRFVSHVGEGVKAANRLMENNQVEDAIAALNDVNRYLESVVNHDLEDQLFKARRESRSFSFDLQISLNNGFSSSFWKEKYEKANTSLRISREAIAGLGSIRVLDRQEEALVYIKTIYDAVVTVKDVVSSVKTQSYLDAVKSAKEGVDGFIENYKAIEEARFQKQQTESLEMYMNGLVRRANRVINAVEPILSFMKANAEEADRFESLLERVQAVKDRVFSGAVQQMVFGDARYTWNYEPFMREAKALCGEIRTENISSSTAADKFRAITVAARASWETVNNNITGSDDEEQKPKMLQWAKEAWEDYETTSRNLFDEAIATVKTVEGKSSDKKGPGVNLFAGASDMTRKPDLFAGSSADSNKEPVIANKENKTVSMFAGQDEAEPVGGENDSQQQPPDSSLQSKPESKLEKKNNLTAKKLGEIYNTGTGDTSTQVGGNYVSVMISELADDDLVEIDVYSGSLKFVHIHLRNSRGVWFSIYNGTNKLFRVGNLVKKSERQDFTHLIFSVNSQHTKNLPAACRANLLLHNGDSISEKVETEFSSQWRAGSGEIPNEYVQKRPNLLYNGQSQSVSNSASASTGTTSAGRSGNSQATVSSGKKDEHRGQTDNKLELANQVNAVIRRADEEFNKKYWNEKAPQQITQKASNSKASSLKIIREAIKISDSANLPENKIFLNNLIANKLIEYAHRVFAYAGKAEFHNEAAALIRRTGDLIDKVNKDKVTVSFLYSDQGDLWRALGKEALVGNHEYNKNACYNLEQAAYERALRIYPENHKAKKALNK
ncbi:MAG: hypothetical protein PHD82_05345 [Candidatus Riflebacteria bacterium]|nr:hypothetical protein [Candidatus Riflebacteria bacterium]